MGRLINRLVSRALQAVARHPDRQERRLRPGPKPGEEAVLPDGYSRAEPWLRPGEWSVVLEQPGHRRPPRPVAMLRTGVPIPAHVDGPAYTRAGTASQGGAVATRSVRIPASTLRADFQADLWLIRREGKWLLFDLARDEVLRWAATPFTDEYVALRREFSRHVPSVGFAPEPSGFAIREPIVAGTMLRELPEDRKLAVCRRMLHHLAELAVAQSGLRSDAPAGPSLSDVFSRSPIEDARRRTRPLTDIFGAGPPLTMPTHGDLGKNNVLVAEDDEPVAIDFGELHRGPYWSDAIRIARVVEHRWAAGELDDVLGTLWAAAGVAPVRWDGERTRLAQVGRVAEAADRELRRTRPPFVALKRRMKSAQIRDDWNRRRAKGERA